MVFPRRSLVFLAILAAVAVGSASSASDDRRPMTPRDLAQIQSMTTAKISPDGSLIAAVRSVPRTLFDQQDGPNWAELYVIDVATGGARPFVTSEVTVSGIDWRPDNSAVSFLAQRGVDEHTKLYLIPTTGGEAQPVVSVETTITGYAWSRDGARVALIAEKQQTEAEKELEEKGFTQEIFEEDVRPLRVWVAEIGAASVPRSLDLEGSAVEVRWSPNGERLAVVLTPQPLVDDRLMFQRVHIVNAATGEVEATVDREGKLGAIEWSPGGGQLAMISGEDIHDPSASSLMVVSADGGAPKNLTLGFEGSVTEFAWLDAEVLVFLADVGVATELYRVSAAGGPSEPLERLVGGVVYTSMSVADDGRHIALIGNSPSHPGEVFALDLADELPPARLTEANPWLAEIRLAPQEVVTFEAGDGLELEGILIRPLDGSQLRPLPPG